MSFSRANNCAMGTHSSEFTIKYAQAQSFFEPDKVSNSNRSNEINTKNLLLRMRKHIVHLNNLDHDILFFQADVE